MGSAASSVQSTNEMRFMSVSKESKSLVLSTKETNKAIDKEIAEEKKARKSLMKILCLGTSCSGKSTILKQMRILHQGGFQDDEKDIHRDAFLRTFIIWAHELISTLPDSVCSRRTKEMESKLLELVNIKASLLKNDSDVFTNILPFFETSEGKEILETYGEGRQCGVFLTYFLQRMEKVENYDEFDPNTEDILRIRVQTTGVVYTTFKFKSSNFCMVDVGGQKTERRKWIHLFDDVKAIFFVVDLSNIEGMVESLGVFVNICSTRELSEANMILFFNKTDIFKQKKDFSALAKQFPNFVDAKCTHREIGLFIKDTFENAFKDVHRNGYIYSFFTCATDTRNIDKTFSACSDIILRKSLAEAGLY